MRSWCINEWKNRSNFYATLRKWASMPRQQGCEPTPYPKPDTALTIDWYVTKFAFNAGTGNDKSLPSQPKGTAEFDPDQPSTPLRPSSPNCGTSAGVKARHLIQTDSSGPCLLAIKARANRHLCHLDVSRNSLT